MKLIEWSAWIISVGLGVWMLYDAIKVSQNFDEEFLTTSVEGIDELLAVDTILQQNPGRSGGVQ